MGYEKNTSKKKLPKRALFMRALENRKEHNYRKLFIFGITTPEGVTFKEFT